MEHPEVTVTLSQAEWRLIARLRDIPESTLKAELAEVLELAVELVREPRCSMVQADGVPCGSPQADCEACDRITGTLATVKQQLASA